MYIENIIEDIVNIYPKFLFDIWNFAAENDINNINANAVNSGVPKNISKNIFLKSKGSMYSI